MDLTIADYSALAPSWLPWGLSHAAGAISSLDPWIFFPALLVCAVGSLCVKLAPRRHRAWCALPFVPSLLLFGWAAATKSSAYWAIALCCVGPLAMLVSRRGAEDPMRRELLGTEKPR